MFSLIAQRVTGVKFRFREYQKPESLKQQCVYQGNQQVYSQLVIRFSVDEHQKTVGLRPVHTYPFLFKNGSFCSPVWPTSPQNATFQKRSPEWRFLNMLASRLRVDGRNLRFSNTMMSYIIYFQHDACSVRDAIVFPSLCYVGMRTFLKKKNGEKESPFTKISSYVWTGPQISKTTTLQVYHAFFYISPPSLHDYDLKIA